jgi:hypothetical protein
MTFLEQIKENFEKEIAKGSEANLKFQVMIQFRDAFKKHNRPELIKYLGHLKIAVNENFMDDETSSEIIDCFARMMISHYDYIAENFGKDTHDIYIGIVQNDMMFALNPE